MMSLFIRLCILLLSVLAASASCKHKTLVTFGDSLTDTGNSFKNSGDKFPSSTYGYFKGRFTNAPGTWADRMTYLTKWQVNSIANYAIGGAAACAFPQLGVPYLDQEISTYLANVKDDEALRKKNRVPVIWAGGIDLLLMAQLAKIDPAAAQAVPGNAVQCMLAGAKKLLDAGHKAITVATVAPVDLTPISIAANARPQLTPIIAQMNAAIMQGLADLRAAYKGHTIALWDVNTDATDFVNNYKEYGFEFPSAYSCLVYAPGASAQRGDAPLSICEVPNQYLFFDPVHPTAASHYLLAKSARKALQHAKIIK